MTEGLPPNWDELLKRIPKIELPPIAKLGVPREVLEQVGRISEQMERALAGGALPPIERLSLTLPRIPTLPDHVVKALQEAGRIAAEEWERGLPRNWAGFEFDEIDATLARVRTTGYALIWVPPVEILREVLAAPTDETASVLLAHRAEIAADMSECLQEVTAPRFLPERDAATAAVAAFVDGHTQASQALASSAFTSTLHEWFKDRGTRRIRKELIEHDPEDVAMSQFRLRTIYLAAAQALEEFRPDVGRPERHRFNRHNTAHRITAAQWTDANALSALMLATVLLREIDHWVELSQQPDAA